MDRSLPDRSSDSGPSSTHRRRCELVEVRAVERRRRVDAEELEQLVIDRLQSLFVLEQAEDEDRADDPFADAQRNARRQFVLAAGNVIVDEDLAAEESLSDRAAAGFETFQPRQIDAER